jgi:broad specificity phosphatase PhoE
METLEEVQKRIVTLMKRWQQKHEDETFAAVTHLAVIRCLLLYTMERSLNDYRKIDIPNATAFVFEVNKKKSKDCLNLKLVDEV